MSNPCKSARLVVLFVAGAAACGTASVAGAQSLSVAERAQRMAKLEEDLSSGDPNLQLAALEQALAEGTVGEKQRAYALAFASSDANLKAVALRYKVCESRQVTVEYDVPANYGPDGYSKNSEFNFLTGVTYLMIGSCEPASGQFGFTLRTVELEGREVTAGIGSVNGGNLHFTFAYRTMNWDYSARVFCEGAFTMAQSSELAGRLACRATTNETFGPVRALIR